jgi:ABC-type nitrate/sulfonate/bicarbonate transport system ATPase subunit
VTPQVQSFCWRIEHQIGEGGFALAVGEPGVGKSASLRILSEHLNPISDIGKRSLCGKGCGHRD